MILIHQDQENLWIQSTTIKKKLQTVQIALNSASGKSRKRDRIVLELQNISEELQLQFYQELQEMSDNAPDQQLLVSMSSQWLVIDVREF